MIAYLSYSIQCNVTIRIIIAMVIIIITMIKIIILLFGYPALPLQVPPPTTVNIFVCFVDVYMTVI